MFEDLLIALTEKSKVNISVNDSDYEQDGLLYCGKCHTPKQCVVEMPFGKVKPNILCKCEEEKINAAEEERKRREFDERVIRLRKQAFPEREMSTWTFARDDMTNGKLSKAMINYVDKFDSFRKNGKGLILYGKVGTGKTFAACEVANALIDRGYSCFVTNLSRIVNTMQGMYDGKQDYLDSLNAYTLLVIDDLGAERGTEYMQEMVFNIIDSRYRSGLPMIITSNLTIDELKNPKDQMSQRIYDRVLERCFPIEVNGASRRRQIIRDEYAGMKEMLGL